MTDGDGTRRATLMFTEGTDGRDGACPTAARTPLDELNVRATEYTIGATRPGGDAGRAARPPRGYTYAVELSVDEAVEAGATEVRFDQPVITYVENFLEFPDRRRRARRLPTTASAGVWVAAPERPRDRDRAGGGST